MQGYDQIQGFEYWNPEAWKNFVKDYVLPLHNSISKLLKLRDFILTMVGTSEKVTLSEVERKQSNILPFLLGGIKEDGEYKDNSLAKLVRLTLGIYINPKEWITLEREEGLKAFDYVRVKIESTSFLEFLKKLEEITLRMIKLVGIEPREILKSEIEEIIQKPKELLEIIRTIYVKCLQVSANHNYYTFFTLSTRTIPFKFMMEAYPRLVDNFNSLRSFLGLEKIFEPRINESKEREAYSIWGHLKDGFSDSLYNLNQAIWEYFANEGVKSIFSLISPLVKDLKQEYLQKIQQKLEEMKWKFPDYIKVSDGSYYKGNTRGVYCYSYVISGPMLIKERSWGYSWRQNFFSIESECNISLLKLFDDISPALFLGSPFFQLKISSDTLEIVGERS